MVPLWELRFARRFIDAGKFTQRFSKYFAHFVFSDKWQSAPLPPLTPLQTTLPITNPSLRGKTVFFFIEKRRNIIFNISDQANFFFHRNNFRIRWLFFKLLILTYSESIVIVPCPTPSHRGLDVQAATTLV